MAKTTGKRLTHTRLMNVIKVSFWVYIIYAVFYGIEYIRCQNNHCFLDTDYNTILLYIAILSYLFNVAALIISFLKQGMKNVKGLLFYRIAGVLVTAIIIVTTILVQVSSANVDSISS